MNELNELVKASSPILIAIAMTVWGKVLKVSPLPNQYIPLVMTLCGAILYMGIEGWTYRNGVLGATIAGLAAVGANQVWKQFINPTKPEPVTNENKT